MLAIPLQLQKLVSIKSVFKSTRIELGKLLTGFVCYDDACHLTKFAKNFSRADLTPQAKQLASVQMVVDKMHMKGHVDKWCKKNCDAKSFADLDKVYNKPKALVTIIILCKFRWTQKSVSRCFHGSLDTNTSHRR